MTPLTVEHRKAVRLIFSNAVMDYLNSPMYRGLTASFVLSLIKDLNYTKTDALKTAIEVQCEALRSLADLTEEHSVNLLQMAREMESKK